MDTNYLKYGKKYPYLIAECQDESVVSAISSERTQCSGRLSIVASNYVNPYEIVGLAHNEACLHALKSSSSGTWGSVVSSVDEYLTAAFGRSLTDVLADKPDSNGIERKLREIAISPNTDDVFYDMIRNEPDVIRDGLVQVYGIIKESDDGVQRVGGEKSAQRHIDSIKLLEARAVDTIMDEGERKRFFSITSIARHSILC